LNIVGDSITLMANDPTPDQGLWTIHSGTGGSFSDPSNPASIFYGVSGIPYYLVWTITNTCGSSSDTVLISFATHGISCGGTLVDVRDGNHYTTVQIGSQCWMAENLAYLPSVSPSSTGSNTSPYYYVPEYQGTNVSLAKATSNYQTYGVLYNWTAAINGDTSSNTIPSGVQGICPDGWYLPSNAEWMILSDSLGGNSVSGGKMKETGTTHWSAPNTGATNSSGLTVLPGGDRHYVGTFVLLEDHAFFWTSGESSSTHASYFELKYNSAAIFPSSHYKEFGFSIRCLKEPCTILPMQSNAGPDLLNIFGDSIVLMANNPSPDQGLWTIHSGTGGSFSDPSNPASIFYGVSGIPY